MPFRKSPYYREVSSSFDVVEKVRERLDNGNVVSSFKKCEEFKLPDRKMFDLKAQLDAGVNLEQVNTKVLDGRQSFDASLLDEFKKSEPKNKKVNDAE